MAYSVLVSAPDSFGFRSYWDLVEVGTKGLGTGLDNSVTVAAKGRGVQHR